MIKHLFLILCLLIMSCNSNQDNDDNDLGIVGSWYGHRYGSIETTDNFRCLHWTFLYDNTYVVADPLNDPVYAHGNFELASSEELILTFPSQSHLPIATMSFIPAIYKIVDNILKLNLYEDVISSEDIINEDLDYGKDFDYIFVNMKEAGIYDCYDDSCFVFVQR